MRGKIMTDTNVVTVQMLDGEAWERGEVAIVGRPATLAEWCGKLVEWGMRLCVMPLSRITRAVCKNIETVRC